MERVLPSHSQHAVLVLGLVGDCTLGKLLAGCSQHVVPAQVVGCNVGRLWVGYHWDRGHCAGSAWTTTPLLSQRFGLFPSWVCSVTWSPITSGGSSLVPCFSLSCSLAPWVPTPALSTQQPAARYLSSLCGVSSGLLALFLAGSHAGHDPGASVQGTCLRPGRGCSSW